MSTYTPYPDPLTTVTVAVTGAYPVDILNNSMTLTTGGTANLDGSRTFETFFAATGFVFVDKASQMETIQSNLETSLAEIKA